jgi:hypothetical protein
MSSITERVRAFALSDNAVVDMKRLAQPPAVESDHSALPSVLRLQGSSTAVPAPEPCAPFELLPDHLTQPTAVVGCGSSRSMSPQHGAIFETMGTLAPKFPVVRKCWGGARE